MYYILMYGLLIISNQSVYSIVLMVDEKIFGEVCILLFFWSIAQAVIWFSKDLSDELRLWDPNCRSCAGDSIQHHLRFSLLHLYTLGLRVSHWCSWQIDPNPVCSTSTSRFGVFCFWRCFSAPHGCTLWAWVFISAQTAAHLWLRSSLCRFCPHSCCVWKSHKIISFWNTQTIQSESEQTSVMFLAWALTEASHRNLHMTDQLTKCKYFFPLL